MIILIGFKNVGKSSIGIELARQMQGSFVDLDEMIEEVYVKHANALRQNCREIVRLHGENYFRALEKSVFAKVLLEKPTVLSLGGGTVMDSDSQALLTDHTVIHITAPYELVFARIMSQGVPSFFSENESPRISFDRLWQERNAIYHRLARFSIDNDGTIEFAAKKIFNYIKIRESS